MKDYEKKYKQALEKAKRLYEQGTITESLAYIFPELKESEDERIRKALIEMVHDTTGDELWVDYNVHKEEALAWLEKQGEQKPAWSDEDEEHLQNCTGAIWAADYYLYEDKQEMEAWLKSLKDRIGG